MGFFSKIFRKRKHKDELPHAYDNSNDRSVPVSSKEKSDNKPKMKKKADILSSAKNAKTAPIKEKKPQKSKVTKVEEKSPAAEATEAKSRTGRFEIKKTKDGRFVFNLYASNHIIVATSQIYASSQSAINGIKSIAQNAERAVLEDTTLKEYEKQSFPKWEIYLDKAEQYRFRLYASNGSCICHSQGYTKKASCKNGISSIVKTAKNAAIDKLYLKNEI